LFITDSNHNRIVITSLDGQLIEIIGSGAMGKQDGSYAEATFDHPQGVALHGETLYITDTENHLLRKVDLKNQVVSTISGIGSQAKDAWPGLDKLRPGDKPPARWVGPPKTTGLNSPWAALVHGKDLYIAMAGPHQIWKMPLDESSIGPYAGNGREDIVDGPLLPKEPYALGFSSFAQPSGLSTDGTSLFVADSEGSSIRAVPFNPKSPVTTVIGTSKLEGGRLFDFGDVDGNKRVAKLQHPLDVAYHDGTIYVADTYNNKIKAVDAKTGEVKTFAGTGKSGKSDSEPSFDEPAGLSFAAGKLYVADTNNSLIRVIDIASGKVSTLTIEGLTPPTVRQKETPPDFAAAPVVELPAVKLKPTDGKVTLQVKLALPAGWKINPLAPAYYYVAETSKAGLIDAAALGKQALAKPAATFDVVLPAKPGETTVTVSMNYYYCQDEAETGLCKVGSVVWKVPITVADDGETSSTVLSHVVPE
ncbi:MAG TPA: NHL repeat-containing protein, partial [Pirellulaceae bacterium]|nr:NHL repeat-containing protein [Pirellulaceae bacterium]